MVSERRSLSFSDEELRHAFDYFDRSKLRGVPSGELRAATVTSAAEDGDFTVALTIVNNDGAAATHEISLGGPQLAAILIHYCMRTGIPLPRLAGKHVSSEGKLLMLNLVLEPKDAAGRRV